MVAVGMTPRTAPPAGGSYNQVLGRTSGWRANNTGQAAIEQVYSPGTWYDNRYFNGPVTGQLSLVQNYCYYVPVYIPWLVTVDALGFYTTASGVNVTMGISTPTTNFLPGTLLGSFTNTASGAGVKIVGIGNVVCSAGWYFLSVGTTNTSQNVNCVSPMCVRAPSGALTSSGGIISNPTSVSLNQYFTDSTGGTGKPRSSPAVITSGQSANIYLLHYRVV